MADSTINSLPRVQDLGSGQPDIQDDDLFVLEQNNVAMSVSGKQITQFVNREVQTYDGQIVASDAAGGASYDSTTKTLTLILPHGPGIKRVDAPTNPGQPGQTDVYTLISEDVALSDPNFHIEEGQPIGTFSVYNGSNGAGMVDSVAGIDPDPQTRNIDKEALLELIYPVGSIYMAVIDVDPGNIFGGVWERIQDCFLMAGGTSTHLPGTSHTNSRESVTLTAENIPAHSHEILVNPALDGTGGPFPYAGAYQSNTTWSGNSRVVTGVKKSDQQGLLISDTAYASTPTAIDIMPTYLSVFVWKRTQ